MVQIEGPLNGGTSAYHHLILVIFIILILVTLELDGHPHVVVQRVLRRCLLPLPRLEVRDQFAQAHHTRELSVVQLSQELIALRVLLCVLQPSIYDQQSTERRVSQLAKLAQLLTGRQPHQHDCWALHCC